MSQNEVGSTGGAIEVSGGFANVISIVRNKVGTFMSFINWVPLVILFLMMLLTSADVLGRYVFSHPLYGAQDVTELGLVVMTFLAIAYMQFMKKHVQVELISSKLSKHTQAVLETFYYFLATGFFAIMSWQSGVRAWAQFLNSGSYKTLTIGFPTYPFMFIIAIGTFLLSLMLLLDFLLSLTRVFKS